MKIEKVILSVEDGTMDCIGGVRREYIPYHMPMFEEVKIKAASGEAILEITFTGDELKKLSRLLGGI